MQCEYDGCQEMARFIVREDYVTGGRTFDTFQAAVCPQHVPPCAGGQDPHFLWACGRPHLMKPIGGKEFRAIHTRPWGFGR